YTEASRFVVFITPLDNDFKLYKLYITLAVGRKTRTNGKSWNDFKYTSGEDGEGQTFDTEARQFLACTYLRPLRDAEVEMSVGRNSRLSQVLQAYSTINSGDKFDIDNLPTSEQEIENLNLSSIAEFITYLVNKNSGIAQATDDINKDYLNELSLFSDDLIGRINFAGGTDDKARLRHILERLELNLMSKTQHEELGRYGLGSNNLLFIACELLLISKDDEGLPLLLIEEPEAHLHPQRQLQLLNFLNSKSTSIQTILSTHSPTLASRIPVENLVLVNNHQAYSLAKPYTGLTNGDYGFLSRFLDTTKSNLFFAHSLVIVEGDAENILLPTIARLIGYDFAKYGVSIVNVGSVALQRYSHIFQPNEDNRHQLDNKKPYILKVASITDRDIMPDSAPEILGWKQPDKNDSRRKWRTENDPLFFEDGTDEGQDRYSEKRQKYASRRVKDDGFGVQTFVSDHWTFEYDLAFSGLAKEVFIAAKRAQENDSDSTRDPVRDEPEEKFVSDFEQLIHDCNDDQEKVMVNVYKLFAVERVSKPLAAQYLADQLQKEYSDTPDKLRQKLPAYLTKAIQYVCE
ncbi:MAG: AAA family ATPase, partial [Bifidobacterium aquikefiri]|uniref:ATP-dependent nuclease n=1 Tax=Bifidobacterium aquikefiri TaxID=1653207 RepID=UPI0039E8B72B